MKKSNILLETFDSLFIMFLCFGTLLTAMLMRGNPTEALKYTINLGTLAITLLGLIVCLTFILRHSEKGLKIIMKQIYLIDDQSV